MRKMKRTKRGKEIEKRKNEVKKDLCCETL